MRMTLLVFWFYSDLTRILIKIDFLKKFLFWPWKPYLESVRSSLNSSDEELSLWIIIHHCTELIFQLRENNTVFHDLNKDIVSNDPLIEIAIVSILSKIVNFWWIVYFSFEPFSKLCQNSNSAFQKYF